MKLCSPLIPVLSYSYVAISHALHQKDNLILLFRSDDGSNVVV